MKVNFDVDAADNPGNDGIDVRVNMQCRCHHDCDWSN
jgi:hypothetical protein